MKPHPIFAKELEERQKANQVRQLVESRHDGLYVIRNGRRLINFSSNDYLGLANNKDTARASKTFIDKYGNGSTASRLITGTGDYHLELEDKLAVAMGTEAALIMNSGYQANITLIPALTGRQSLILSDKFNHNSLLQGAILSRGKLQRYRHNDTAHLEALLQKAADQFEHILIITESVFSMDGDVAKLKAISKLARTYGAQLMVDEAHALGVLGRGGMGLCAGQYHTDLVMGTFGKSFGSFGAFIACSNEMRDYLINFCGGFIYTTALPPAVIGAASKALQLIPGMDKERELLSRNAQYLRSELQKAGFDTMGSSSQIIPVSIGSEERTLALSSYLEEHGIFAIAIRPPTVAKNSSRMRITINSQHAQKHIDHLLNVITTWNG